MKDTLSRHSTVVLQWIHCGTHESNSQFADFIPLMLIIGILLFVLGEYF